MQFPPEDQAVKTGRPHPIDDDLKERAFTLLPEKPSRKDYRHIQNLTAQWQLARNLWLVQIQMAHNTAAMLANIREWQEPVCDGCGRKFHDE